MSIAYLNQKFVPLDRAKISILDRGFLYGDGVFETMRSYAGCVFHLEKHLIRLFKSLKILDIHPKIEKSKIKKIMYKLLEKNKLKDAYIKIIITRGKASGLLIPSKKVHPTIAIYTLPYKPLSRNVYEKGIKALVSKTRFDEKSQISGNKTLNFLPNVLYRYQAKSKGFDDTIVINTKGFVCEASSSNIFLVKGKRLNTPCLGSGCLAGITRAEIVRLAKKFLESKVNQSFINKTALYNADEMFLTNSLVEIIPVVKIDNQIVGRGNPGPITKRLTGLFKNSIKDYCKKRRQKLK